jgi:hypothetical protein
MTLTYWWIDYGGIVSRGVAFGLSTPKNLFLVIRFLL